VGEQLSGQWAYEDTHASHILLDGVALGDDTPRLARYLLEDFQHYAAARKAPDRKALLVVDEFSALRVPNAAALLERLRSFGVGVVIASQSVEGLHDDPNERARLLGAATTVIAHRLADPEPVAGRGGTVHKPERSHQLDIDRENVQGAEEFDVAPAAGGGLVPFTAALVRLFLRKSREGLWWAAINIRGEYFANLGPGYDGRLWTEVCSNAYLPEGFKLGAAQESELLRLGWLAPTGSVEEGLANFWREWDAAELPLAVAFVVDTLVGVYGFREDDLWRVAVDPFKSEEGGVDH
jgi:hypothetical protein